MPAVTVVDNDDIAISPELACAVDCPLCQGSHTGVAQTQSDTVVVVLCVAGIRPDDATTLPVIGKIRLIGTFGMVPQGFGRTADAGSGQQENRLSFEEHLSVYRQKTERF